MNRREIVDYIYNEIDGDCPKGEIDKILVAYLSFIKKTVKEKGRFNIPKVGTFYVSELKPRLVRNPKTGEVYNVPAKKTVRFKVSPTFKKEVRG